MDTDAAEIGSTIRKKRWHFVVALLVTTAILGVCPVGAATSPKLFGSDERRSDNLEPFKKWNGALAKYSKEIATLKEGTCQERQFNKCHYDEWNAFVESVKNLPPEQQIDKVNSYMNRAKYITDPVNWGAKDYWASPGEFILNFGDCEDYAIAKFLTLRKLGFPAQSLRVVAVQDMNLKVGHAILAVYLGDHIAILDNQIKTVTNAAKIHHYVPVFSINEHSWWRHRK